jgi:hypothetical protein
MVGTCLSLINCLSNLGIILGRPPEVLENLGPSWPRSSRICPPIDCIRQTCQDFRVLTSPVLPECFCKRYRALAKITRTLTRELVRRLIIANCLINRLTKPELAFTPITPLTHLVTFVDIETIFNCFLSFISLLKLNKGSGLDSILITRMIVNFWERVKQTPSKPVISPTKVVWTLLNGLVVRKLLTPWPPNINWEELYSSIKN